MNKILELKREVFSRKIFTVVVYETHKVGPQKSNYLDLTVDTLNTRFCGFFSLSVRFNQIHSQNNNTRNISISHYPLYFRFKRLHFCCFIRGCLSFLLSLVIFLLLLFLQHLNNFPFFYLHFGTYESSPCQILSCFSMQIKL